MSASAATNEWSACPPGTLTAIPRELAARRRTRGAVASVLLLAAVGVAALAGSRHLAGPASITCTDCLTARDRFVAGASPPSETAAVENHLSTCPLCRDAYGAVTDVERFEPSSAPPLAVLR